MGAGVVSGAPAVQRELLRVSVVGVELVVELAPALGARPADDLARLADLMQAGTLSPVIDRRYGLQEVPDAIRYSEEGRARGKIIISLE